MYWYMFREVMLHECIGFFLKRNAKKHSCFVLFFLSMLFITIMTLKKNETKFIRGNYFRKCKLPGTYNNKNMLRG